MPFEQGRMKTGGRMKGVENKITFEVREMMESFINDNKGEFHKAWKELSNVEKVRTYFKAAEFVIPKAKPQILSDPYDNDVGFEVIIR